jgi:23S rRNA U2552 (ribose-2'-O)-methylase RlmE/FtsJ
MKEITGHTQYKGYTAMQHFDYEEVFTKFLQEHQFDRVLEIGTASGGMTLFLRDALPNAQILSYDINEVSWYSNIRQHDIDIRVQDIFDKNIQTLTNTANIIDDYALNFIKNAKKLLVLCDGGNKIGEFNCIAKYLKSGDFIMAHDYSYSKEYFEEHIKNKIWLWCEITEEYIADSCKIHGLEDYNREEFQSVVWVCKQKK